MLKLAVPAARAALSAAIAIAALSACAGTAADAGGDDRVPVVAAFYPLQFAVEQVGGEHVAVTGLTKPGTEPHDLELSPRDVARLGDAKLVVYEKGFQPAVDDAVAQQARDAGFDVSGSARLDIAAAEPGHEGESAEEHESHAEGVDPHFWLDPTRYAGVGTAIAERLAKDDPTHRTDYLDNAKAFEAKLTDLDAEFRAGLRSCASKDLVTGHAAFGYLAARYGLTQEGIAGVSPDAEPDAAAMKELAAHVREHGVKTVYAETLVSPELAEAIARESGAAVAVLDPIEGITDASRGKDYFEVMRSNLDTLKNGQSCT